MLAKAKPFGILFVAAAALLTPCPRGGPAAVAQASAPAAQPAQEGEQTRDVYSTDFTDARPPGKGKAAAARPRYKPRNPGRSSPAAAPKGSAGTAAPTSRRPPTKGKVYASVGVTVGSGRPATGAESHDASIAKVRLGDGRELVFERLAADRPVAHGSLIQMSIEYLASGDAAAGSQSSRAGYLYVLNRVRFPDGTLGPPRLIFPTPRTDGGDNRVLPGRPVMLPSPDRPWQITRSRSGPAQAFETYVIIVSPEPLKDADGFELRGGRHDPRALEALLAGWTRRWGGGEEQAELEGGAGRLLSRREQAASADPNEPRRDTGELEEGLTQDDPQPQLVFSKAVSPGEAMLVTLELPFQDGPPAP